MMIAARPASEVLRNYGLTGVILMSERSGAAVAQASAGPKDLLADAARLWRGSVPTLEVAARASADPLVRPFLVRFHSGREIGWAVAAALANRRLDCADFRGATCFR